MLDSGEKRVGFRSACASDPRRGCELLRTHVRQREKTRTNRWFNEAVLESAKGNEPGNRLQFAWAIVRS